MLGFICLIIPVVWLLWLLLRTCLRRCNVCLNFKTPERSPRALRVAQALSLFFGAASVCGAASVWAAGGKLRDTLREVGDLMADQVRALVNGAVTVQGIVAQVAPAFTAVGASTTALNNAAAQLGSAASKIEDKLDKNQSNIRDALDRMELACTLLGAFLILLVLLAWLSHALAPRRPLRHVLGVSGFLQWVWLVVGASSMQRCVHRFAGCADVLRASGWVICSITYIIYLVISDMCLALPSALSDPIGTGLASVVPCYDPAFVANSQTAVRSPIYAAMQAANNGLRACSAQGPVGVDYLCNPVVLTGSAYTSRATPCAAGYTTSLAAYNSSYTATSCPNLPAASLGNLKGVMRATGALTAATPRVDALLNCSYITSTLAVVESHCGELRGGARGLFGGLLLCCLAFGFFLCTLVWVWRHAYEQSGAMVVVGVAVDGDGKLADMEAPAPAAEGEAAAEPTPAEAQK